MLVKVMHLYAQLHHGIAVKDAGKGSVEPARKIVNINNI